MINKQNIVSIVKKYCNNNLKTLAKISSLTHEHGFAYYRQIEEFLNRGKNQISNILAILEHDNLITRDKSHRPQKIFLTSTGKEVMEKIKSFFL